MSSTGFRIAIVNPLTLVGKEIQSILNERGIPYARMELIDTTGENSGALTEINDEAAFVSDASNEAFAGLDLAFFCGPTERNEPWLERAEEDGVLAIDVSQPGALNDDAIPVVAGVNEERLTEGMVAQAAHPIAVPIVLMLQQLLRVTDIDLLAVSVIQPASEKGKEGVDELFQQTINALNMQAIPKSVFDRQLAFNLYPAPEAAQVESAVAQQIERILGKSLPVTISLTQGTTFHGHSFSIFLQTKEEVDEETLRGALGKGMSLDVAQRDDTVTTIDAAGRDQVLIGRVQRDAKIPRGWWLWAVADNLRRSSALNAVMIAETMLAKFGEKAN